MSISVGYDPCLSPSTLAADQHRAEGLLVDLATELRRITVEERTRALHVRALSLRGLVARWSEDHPDEATRQAICDEVIALLHETRNWRGCLRSGTQQAHRERSEHQERAIAFGNARRG